MAPPWRIAFVVVALSTALGPFDARATTLVYDNDGELAEQSEAVVLGKVVDVGSEYVPETHGVRTRVRIRVDTVVAGRADGNSVELTELGGEVAELSEKVFGVPSYRVGERVLVFLQRDRHGRLHTTGLSAGKYTVQANPGGAWVARRDYRGASLLRPRSHRFDRDPRPEERPLADVIAEAQAAFAARGIAPPRIQLPPPGDDVDFSAPFSLLGSARWFEADAGQPVSFWLDLRGLRALGPVATEQAMQAAMEAWNRVPDSTLRLEVAGAAEPVPFQGCSGPTRITFDDPFQELNDPRECRGILAVGGYCPTRLGVVRNGVTFDAIVIGKVVFNDGWDACSIWTPCNVEEVATHELGHAIGLGHSSDSSATMAAYAHFDGRCAALAADDVNGLRFLYGETRPDLVLLPRSPVTLRIPAGAQSVTKEIALQLRNADRLAVASSAVEARLEVGDGTCPMGTVQAVDSDPKTPGVQDTVSLKPRQTKTVRVLVGVTSDTVSTPLSRSPQRCVLQASLLPLAHEGEDRTPANNTAAVVLELSDGNDLATARLQVARETTISSLSPVRIVLPIWMPVQSRVVPFRIRNLDIGAKEGRTVTVNVDLGDCPAGMVSGLDVSPAAGDQNTVFITPGATIAGQLLLTPPPGSIFTPSRTSPFRCTLSLQVSAADGEANLSDNVAPLVVDVIDGTDF